MTCECCDDRIAHDPLTDFRDYHVIFLADVDGVIWASNSYWAVPVPNSEHRIARVFAAYNLPLTPGTYAVSYTLTEQYPVKVKDLKKLVLDAVPDGLEQVEPNTIHGAQVYVKGSYSENQWLAVWRIPGGVAVLDDERLRLVERMAPEGEWYATADPSAMFVRKKQDGTVTAVLMSMRHKASDQ
jgi:hypothetical protein